MRHGSSSVSVRIVAQFVATAAQLTRHGREYVRVAYGALLALEVLLCRILSTGSAPRRLKTVLKRDAIWRM